MEKEKQQQEEAGKKEDKSERGKGIKGEVGSR